MDGFIDIHLYGRKFRALRENDHWIVMEHGKEGVFARRSEIVLSPQLPSHKIKLALQDLLHELEKGEVSGS